MEAWIRVVVLSFGGALGVNARYWLGVWIDRGVAPRFPWATFLINVSGSFTIGLVSIILARRLPGPNARLLVITGFLGGFTTFSAFSYEALALWERGAKGSAISYVVCSVATGIVAVVLGVALGRALVPFTGWPADSQGINEGTPRVVASVDPEAVPLDARKTS